MKMLMFWVGFTLVFVIIPAVCFAIDVGAL